MLLAGNIEKAVEQEEKLSDEMESVRELTYLGDKMSIVGGYEAVETVRGSCGWVKVRECGKSLCGKFSSKAEMECL